MSSGDQSERHGRNRLAGEKSPYLLQHADNPVNWYPWGDEAFEAAKREDKPIFLSIGYSTCHWCHVMEHESFEDSVVAALMNDAFISIKVDREERPDIDNIYMTVCQMLTGSGGWPLTIVMTPDRKPFFAGTYFPKGEAYGRSGMLSLVPALKDAWENRRDEIASSSDTIMTHLADYARGGAPGEEPGAETIGLAERQLSERFDTVRGGFGMAPKFPSPHNLLFLLRYWKRSGDANALGMVEKTLDAMSDGGIYDHVGFGFHRYSTDARWFAPHFEKMLYDQALLVMAYTEAYAATGKVTYRRTAEEILAYVRRDMTAENGAFLSAEDADSEGIEGKFYLWTRSEITEILGEEDAGLFADVYGVTDSGNFSNEVPAGNILYLRRPLAAVAAEMGTGEDDLRARLDDMKARLYHVRSKRTYPHKDDKVLTDWNGLMIAAMALAGRVFDAPDYIRGAERAAAFVTGTMRDRRGQLLHRYRDGDAALTGNLDDYAFVVWGLIELYEATFDIKYLETALDLNDKMLTRFWDGEGGGLFFTPAGDERLIVRMKESSDGAIPSGNSVAMLNLIRLGRMSANTDLEQKARSIGVAFADNLGRAPIGYTQMLSALVFVLGPTYEVVIVGKPDAPDTQAMLRALNAQYAPNLVTLFKPAGERKPRVSDLAPFTADHASVAGKATAYVCVDYACKLPTTDASEMVASVSGTR